MNPILTLTLPPKRKVGVVKGFETLTREPWKTQDTWAAADEFERGPRSSRVDQRGRMSVAEDERMRCNGQMPPMRKEEEKELTIPKGPIYT